ncbi:LacI family transcription regulator [Leifsonia xyli subsp. cynodontis DSM 46306]|uniref:HTH lacI-type domain-containing protein n=1 Tax=Leifsonia xyli subsp. cynodontis DSM 46306 TaxID=1389489 RepID=U3P741_LEIXC|nr:LacI family DNA-binding transcriptional regulator [Leifsonia xyli]AGW42105.1 LacI family transcription regulator [Leifsonia xyli subsp. cynodontis DSM 46306]
MAARPRAKTPTILDIAAEAGVSKSAVSRALRGSDDVSPESRAKVERAAKKLGYVANAMARGMRTSSRTLGVVLRDVKRPYYAWLQAAMQQEAESRGYQAVTMTSVGELEVADALRALRSLISLQVVGLVIASARLPSEEIVPFIDRVPIVVAGRKETDLGITSVFCDDADGGRMLAEHLLALGHRRIAVALVEQAYSLSQHARGAAMIDTIRGAGGEAVAWPVPSDMRAGEVVAARVGDTDVTAIMCPTDTAMMDVLDVLRQRGRSVPGDYAVTGYDGFGPLSAPYLGLTTFRQPVEEIGRMSIALLVDKIEGRSSHDSLVSLRGTVVAGRTAGPAAFAPLATAD